MTVAELIRQLEEYDGDLEVRIGEQPSWPLQYEIEKVYDNIHCPEYVYIIEGEQIGYFTKEAWD